MKAANVPLVPGVKPPAELDELPLFTAGGPLIVGLTNDPASLVQVRRNRLRMLNELRETDYTDLESVKAEVVASRRLFVERGWPVLETSRRSIEETAAAIMSLLAERGPGAAQQLGPDRARRGQHHARHSMPRF